MLAAAFIINILTCCALEIIFISFPLPQTLTPYNDWSVLRIFFIYLLKINWGDNGQQNYVGFKRTIL